MSALAPRALPAEPVAQLEGVIDRLTEEDLQLVPASSLGDDLRGLRVAIDRLEAEFSRRLERFDRDQGYVFDGHLSSVGWLSRQCRITRSTAWERVRQAKRLGELPGTSEAFAAGQISQAHVGVITRAAEQVGCEALRDAEPILLVSWNRGPQHIRGIGGRSQGKGGDRRSAFSECVTTQRRAP